MVTFFYRKWVFLAAIILATYFFAAKSRSPLCFFFFWCALLFAVFCIAAAVFVYATAQLTLARRHRNKVEEGESLEVEITLRNNSFFPLVNIVIEDVFSNGAQKHKIARVAMEYIAGGSVETFAYACPCEKRGLYHLGAFTVYFFDPIGLFYLKKVYPVISELCVYPKTFPIHTFPYLKKGTSPWFGIDTARTTGDEDEYFGVREYKAGDVISKIHWLSSARHNALIVKQFQRLNFYRATIIFTLEKGRDYGEGKESVAEYTVQIAASVAKYLLARNVAVELIAHTGEFVHIPLSKGAEQVDDMMAFLAAARAESPISLGEVFEDYFQFVPNDSNVIVIMLDEDWKYLMRMLPLEKRNMCFVPLVLVAATFIYPVNPREIRQDVQRKLSGEFSSAPLFISRGDNLEEVFLRG